MPTTLEELVGEVEPFDVRVSLLQETRNFTVPELRAVLFVARRLSMGRKKYGPLNPDDGRDWLEELKEELADALVYLSSEEQRTAKPDGFCRHGFYEQFCAVCSKDAPQGVHSPTSGGEPREYVSVDEFGWTYTTRAPSSKDAFASGSEDCI